MVATASASPASIGLICTRSDKQEWGLARAQTVASLELSSNLFASRLIMLSQHHGLGCLASVAVRGPCRRAPVLANARFNTGPAAAGWGAALQPGLVPGCHRFSGVRRS